MSGTPTLYCRSCKKFRALQDWRERGEALVIELAGCHHVFYRRAAMEWPL